MKCRQDTFGVSGIQIREMFILSVGAAATSAIQILIGDIVLTRWIDIQETLHSLEVGQVDGQTKEIPDMDGVMFLFGEMFLFVKLVDDTVGGMIVQYGL